jgi:hypothetical protein
VQVQCRRRRRCRAKVKFKFKASSKQQAARDHSTQGKAKTTQVKARQGHSSRSGRQSLGCRKTDLSTSSARPPPRRRPPPLLHQCLRPIQPSRCTRSYERTHTHTHTHAHAHTHHTTLHRTPPSKQRLLPLVLRDSLLTFDGHTQPFASIPSHPHPPSPHLRRPIPALWPPALLELRGVPNRNSALRPLSSRNPPSQEAFLRSTRILRLQGTLKLIFPLPESSRLSSPPHSRVLCCRLLYCYPLLLSPEGVERVAQNKQSTGSACDYHQSSLLHGRLTRNNFCFLPGWEVCDVKQGNHTHHEGQSLRPLLPQSSAGQGGFVLTMQFLQALRRSLKNDREKVNHISITPKSAVAIVPPKKVCSHRPGLPHPRGVC